MWWKAVAHGICREEGGVAKSVGVELTSHVSTNRFLISPAPGLIEGVMDNLPVLFRKHTRLCSPPPRGD